MEKKSAVNQIEVERQLGIHRQNQQPDDDENKLNVSHSTHTQHRIQHPNYFIFFGHIAVKLGCIVITFCHDEYGIE